MPIAKEGTLDGTPGRFIFKCDNCGYVHHDVEDIRQEPEGWFCEVVVLCERCLGHAWRVAERVCRDRQKASATKAKRKK